MQWWHIVLGIVFGLIVFMITISFIGGRRAITKLTFEEFKKNMRKGQLIDVRNRSEYEAGHINGARHIPFAVLAHQYSKLRSDRPIYLYCNNGKLSRRAGLYLWAREFTDLYILEKGLKSWTDPLKKKK